MEDNVMEKQPNLGPYYDGPNGSLFHFSDNSQF